MPELPEVEAARRALEDHCIGKRILKCTAADDTKVIDGVSRADFESSLPGKSIVSVHRKGKNLWIRLDSPPFPSFQFGMTGSFYIKGVAVTKYKRSAVSESEEWPSKFSKVFLVLDDGLEVSFTDKRRFAKVRLLDDPESAPPISALGPDALYEPMQVDELAGLLSKKKIPIKALLLDQGFISGIGNWVADEVLYQARIHPEQTAATLSKESCESLHKAIKEVLETALEVGADSTQYPINWIFHSRDKKPGNTHVDGKKIEFIIAGGRTTAYVPELQKLSGNATVKSARSKKPKKNNGGKDGSDSEKEKDEARTAKKGSKKSRKKDEDKPKKSVKGTTTKLAKAEEGPSKKRAKPSKASHDDADEDEPQIPEKGTGKKQMKAEEEPSKKRAKPSKASHDDADEDEPQIPEKGTGKKKLKAEEEPSKKRAKPSRAIINDVDKDEPQNPEKGTEKKQAKATKEPSKKIAKPSKASRDDVDEDEPQNPEKGAGKKQAKAEEGPLKKIAKPNKVSHVDKDEPQKTENDTGKKRAKAEEEPSKKRAKSSKASRGDGDEDEPHKSGKGTAKKQAKAEEAPLKKRGNPSKAGVQQKK